MAKKSVSKTPRNTASAGAAMPGISTLPVAEGGSAGGWEYAWPEALKSPRSALFMGGAVIVLAALVACAASLDGFTAVKIMVGSLLGNTIPEQIANTNYDIALVIWGLLSVAFLGYIHPAIGLCLLLLARSWLDGYTFPADNVYFTWSIYLLCAFWLVRFLRRKESFHAPAPVWMFAGILLVLFVTSPFSCQYYNTYQMLWLWLGYGLLFLMCLNILRDSKVAAILLAVFLVAMGAQAIFSIFHFEYLLPFMRKAVQNPAVLRAYFNTDTISPDMARRFMINRAFGTMLFPNALGAYLVLGIPLVLMMVVPYLRDLLHGLKQRPKGNVEPAMAAERIVLLGLAIGVGLFVFIALQLLAFFPKEYREPGEYVPIYLRTAPLAALTLAAALMSGIATLYLLMRFGIRLWWLLMRFLGTALLLPVLVYTLWITYSRGAYLGLLVSLAWAGVIFFIRPAHLQRLRSKIFLRKAGLALLVLTLFLCLSLSAIRAGSQGLSWAQETRTSQDASAPGPVPQKAAGTQVKTEGISLSANDLADPASLRLRFGYWQVTARMALDNLLTGVGMGNFAIAYPAYQYVGAADVREAHNGFLQFFAETGLIGGILFAAFWAYLVLWGAWRIIHEERKREKLILLGIYAGLVAFCLHAGLDINFSHPSLVMFVMAYCGLFYARAYAETPATATGADNTAAGRNSFLVLLASGILLVLLIAVGASGRTYLQNLALNRVRFINLSFEDELNRRIRAGNFFFQELAQCGRLMNRGETPKELPRISLAQAGLIVSDMDVLSSGCRFYRPEPNVPGRFVRLEKDEPVPGNAMVVVYKPWEMRKAAIESAREWMAELERQDRRFPYSPLVALHILKWHEIYAHTVRDDAFNDRHAEWASAYMQWAETLMKRNPNHADTRSIYGSALVWSALDDNQPDVDGLLARAEAEYREMLRLTPISPAHRFSYAGVLNRIADYFDKKGEAERAAQYRKQAQEIQSQAVSLEEQRRNTFLYP